MAYQDAARLSTASLTDIEGGDDQLIYRSSSDDTFQEEIEGIATILSIGFAHYATLVGFRRFVAVRSLKSIGGARRGRSTAGILRL